VTGSRTTTGGKEAMQTASLIDRADLAHCEVAAHRNDIDFCAMTQAEIDRAEAAGPGHLVRVVVGPHIQSQVRALGGQQNSIQSGDLLPAVIIRTWGGPKNLKVFVDGARDLWITSVEHYPVVAQLHDPEKPERPLFHARADTWHFLDQPDSYVTEELKIPTAAGFDWRDPGCSMCLAMNPDKLSPGERSASTSNRNFEGRQGRGGRTHQIGRAHV